MTFKTTFYLLQNDAIDAKISCQKIPSTPCLAASALKIGGPLIGYTLKIFKFSQENCSGLLNSREVKRIEK